MLEMAALSLTEASLSLFARRFMGKREWWIRVQMLILAISGPKNTFDCILPSIDFPSYCNCDYSVNLLWFERNEWNHKDKHIERLPLCDQIADTRSEEASTAHTSLSVARQRSRWIHGVVSVDYLGLKRLIQSKNTSSQ